MPSRLLFTLGAMAMVIAGCSRQPEGTASMMPSAPSTLTASSPDGGSGMRPAVIALPPRNDGIDFRAQLEKAIAVWPQFPRRHVDQRRRGVDR